jgi:hypothetical protein
LLEKIWQRGADKRSILAIDPDTTQASWCSSALAADVKSFRAPAILFASEAAG